MWDDVNLGRITITNRAVINRPGPLVIGEPKVYFLKLSTNLRAKPAKAKIPTVLTFFF